MRVPRLTRALDWTLLATIIVTTWHKIHWSAGGADVTLEDLLALVFLGLFCAERIRRRDAGRIPRVCAGLLLALFALEAVFLASSFNLDTQTAFTQYAKGMAKYLIHFAFVIAGVWHVVLRGRAFLFRTVGALVAGITLNAVYGVAQLAAQVVLGVNLDRAIVGPLTFGQGGVGGINVFGGTQTVSQGEVVNLGVFRVNALALDPNHLGIMLCVPILILLPFALREGLRTRRGLALAALIAFLAAVQLLALSRSAYFGLFFGLLVLAVPYRRALLSPRLLVPVGVGLVALALLAAQSSYLRTVASSRLTLSDRSAQVHYQLFALVPPVLQMHPLLGLGLNTFSVYYAFETGRTDWGPHSFYVALIAETGLIGTTVFLLFLAWIGLRLAVLVRASRILAGRGDPEAARAGPLAYGLAAAFVATLTANVFYLTMQFYYFYALVLVAVAASALWAPEPAREAVRSRLAPQPA